MPGFISFAMDAVSDILGYNNPDVDDDVDVDVD